MLLLLLGFVQWVAFGAARRHRLISPSQPLNFLSPILYYMNFKNFLKLPASKYSIRTIVSWLWGAWRGNRLQAILNASIGLLDVAVSLAQVWAVKNAIDAIMPHNLYDFVALILQLLLI